MKMMSLMLCSIVLINCSKSNGSGNGVTVPPVNPPPAVTTGDTINSWLTKADQSALLLKQNALVLSNTANSYSSITVDSTSTFQTIDGFGYTLTGGSAQVINTLDAATKSNLLRELFGNASNSISISYLRISIGASDLNTSVFSYDDVAGDTTLSQFSLAKDETDLIPLLKQIVAVNHQ